MTVYNVSKPYKLDPAKRTLGVLEVRMNPDFVRDDARTFGIVDALALTQKVTIDLLRIVGDRNWSQRFEQLNWDFTTNTALDWRPALGGMGGQTALCGLHVTGGARGTASKLRVKRLEVVGVPGAAVRLDNDAEYQHDSAYFERTGWAVQTTVDVPKGPKLGPTLTRDHWYSAAWSTASGFTPQAQGCMPAVALRGLQDRGIWARGELVALGAGIELRDFVMTGDGNGAKLGGPGCKVIGGQSPHIYLCGTVPQPPSLQGPLYDHLAHCEQMEISDHVFEGTGAVHRLLGFAQGRMIDAQGNPSPAHYRRNTYFCRPPVGTLADGMYGAFQFMQGAHIVFDGGDVIGRTAETFFEHDGTVTVEGLETLRFYNP